MNHAYVIRTGRLLLRQVVEKDLPLVMAWRNSDAIRKWFFNKEIISASGQNIWYQSYLQNERDIMFIMEETENLNAPVGTVALSKIDMRLKESEVGRLMVGDGRARGKGLGPEAVSACCDFGFRCLGLKKIYANVYSDNKKSLGTFGRAGFIVAGEEIRHGRAFLRLELESN